MVLFNLLLAMLCPLSPVVEIVATVRMFLGRAANGFAAADTAATTTAAADSVLDDSVRDDSASSATTILLSTIPVDDSAPAPSSFFCKNQSTFFHARPHPRAALDRPDPEQLAQLNPYSPPARTPLRAS